MGKLILRQVIRNKVFSLDAYQGLGLHLLKLDELAYQLGYESVKNSAAQLSLTYMKDAHLNVVISISPFKTKKSDHDESGSIASFTSDMSTLGATFSFDSDNVFDTDLPFEFDNASNLDKLRSSVHDEDPSGQKSSRRGSRSIELNDVNVLKPPVYAAYRKDAAAAAAAAAVPVSSSSSQTQSKNHVVSPVRPTAISAPLEDVKEKSTKDVQNGEEFFFFITSLFFTPSHNRLCTVHSSIHQRCLQDRKSGLRQMKRLSSCTNKNWKTELCASSVWRHSSRSSPIRSYPSNQS